MPHSPIGLTMLGVFLVGIWAAAARADSASQTRLVGNLTTIDGKSLTITPESGAAVTLTCNDATKYRRDSAPTTPTSSPFTAVRLSHH